MNEQDRAWYNEWSRELYERKSSEKWQNDFAAEWYESMDRYREERIREKQEIANRKVDSFDPWCDNDGFDIPFLGGLDPGDYGFI